MWFSSLVTPNGSAIRSLREAHGVSLRQLSALTGRDRGFLSRLERGLTGASDQTLRGIAVALNVPVAAINREEAP
ncbi:helix-turn-helix domain-containing protein [Kitasatospora sp. NPDC004289]